MKLEIRLQFIIQNKYLQYRKMLMIFMVGILMNFFRIWGLKDIVLIKIWYSIFFKMQLSINNSELFFSGIFFRL